MPQKILIADDHVLMRDALAILLTRSFSDVDLDTASSYSETVQSIQAWHKSDAKCPSAHVVILDLRMPGMQGIQLIEQLVLMTAPHPVVIYSEIDNKTTSKQLMQMGVFAVEHKSEPAEVLLNSVRQALSLPLSHQSLSQSHQSGIPQPMPTMSLQGIPAPNDGEELTLRQWDMLRALHKGLPNKMIAREYGVALGTVKNHLFMLYERLGVKSRSEALHKTRDWFV